MKLTLNIYIFLLLFQNCDSQILVVKDSTQEIFPLKVGNLWQYWTYDFLNGQTTWIYGWTTKISKDSILYNDLKEYFFESDGGYGFNGYFRQVGNIIFDEENNVVYNFNKSTNDTIKIIPIESINDTIVQIIAYDTIDNIFGIPKRVWGYLSYYKHSTSYLIDEIAEGFGWVSSKAEAGDEWILRGAIIDDVHYGIVSGVKYFYKEDYPKKYVLEQNYPNPFNSKTMIKYYIDHDQYINLSIYNSLGQLIITLVNEFQSTGTHKYLWNGNNSNDRQVSSGFYTYRLQGDKFVTNKKMLMIK